MSMKESLYQKTGSEFAQSLAGEFFQIEFAIDKYALDELDLDNYSGSFRFFKFKNLARHYLDSVELTQKASEFFASTKFNRFFKLLEVGISSFSKEHGFLFPRISNDGTIKINARIVLLHTGPASVVYDLAKPNNALFKFGVNELLYSKKKLTQLIKDKLYDLFVKTHQKEKRILKRMIILDKKIERKEDEVNKTLLKWIHEHKDLELRPLIDKRQVSFVLNKLEEDFWSYVDETIVSVLLLHIEDKESLKRHFSEAPVKHLSSDFSFLSGTRRKILKGTFRKDVQRLTRQNILELLHVFTQIPIYMLTYANIMSLYHSGGLRYIKNFSFQKETSELCLRKFKKTVKSSTGSKVNKIFLDFLDVYRTVIIEADNKMNAANISSLSDITHFSHSIDAAHDAYEFLRKEFLKLSENIEE